MSSQPERPSIDDALVHDTKGKQQAASSFSTSADRMTVEEREDEREAITQARAGGFERVVSEQRLPAEGIGASAGEIRHAFSDVPDDDSASERGDSGKRPDSDRERPDEIRC